MTFADASGSDAGSVAPVRQSAARSVTMPLRLIVAPFALLAAAIAGVLFAVLLPICGIATISEGIARGAWRFVRGTLERAPRSSAHRI